MSRQIIIACHGTDLIGGQLSTNGAQQIHALVERMLPKLMTTTSVVVVSALTQSTTESAGIIARRLNLRPGQQERDSILSSDLRRDSDFSETLTLIRRLRKFDVVILVGHAKQTQKLPHIIGIAEIGRDAYFEQTPLNQGEAWLIDLEAKTCTRV